MYVNTYTLVQCIHTQKYFLRFDTKESTLVTSRYISWLKGPYFLSHHWNTETPYTCVFKVDAKHTAIPSVQEFLGEEWLAVGSGDKAWVDHLIEHTNKLKAPELQECALDYEVPEFSLENVEYLPSEIAEGVEIIKVSKMVNSPFHLGRALTDVDRVNCLKYSCGSLTLLKPDTH